MIAKAALRGSAGAFVNRILIDTYLSHIEQAKPALAAEVERAIDKDLLAQVLRQLVKEGVSVRDLPSILHGMLSARDIMPVPLSKYIVFAHAATTPMLSPEDRDGSARVDDYVEYARACCRRYISHKYTRGQSTLIVYLLDPQFEERLAQARPLTPDEINRVSIALQREMPSTRHTPSSPVILTTQECRGRLQKAIYHEFPKLAVLSYQELSPEMNIQPVARISVAKVRKYDESFYAFIDALPVEVDVEPAAAPSGRPATAAARVVDSRLGDLVDRVMQDIREDHPHDFSDRATRAFVARVVRGFGGLLAGDPRTMETVCRDVALVAASKRIKISHAVGIPLMIATAIRNLLAEDAHGDGPMTSLDSARAEFEPLRRAAIRAANMLRDAGLRTRYARLFQ
jgi:hypothetical protein